MDDNFDDYFVTAQEPETPQELPESPQEREEREIREATIERRHNTLRIVMIGLIALLAFILCWWTWQHWFNPYSETVEKGWVLNIANRGTVFKTYEGTMLTVKYMDDSIAGIDTLQFSIVSARRHRRRPHRLSHQLQTERCGHRLLEVSHHLVRRLPHTRSIGLSAIAATV